jgi:hypothetical protein
MSNLRFLRFMLMRLTNALAHEDLDGISKGGVKFNFNDENLRSWHMGHFA